MDESSIDEVRRTVLKTAGATVALGAFGAGTASAKQTYTFDGDAKGWTGTAPSAISGQKNPTLELTAGEKYTVVWKNVDDAPHTFTLEDANGNKIEGTSMIETQGKKGRLTFTATEDMAAYYCEVHPEMMRGSINVSPASSGGSGASSKSGKSSASNDAGASSTADSGTSTADQSAQTSGSDAQSDAAQSSANQSTSTQSGDGAQSGSAGSDGGQSADDTPYDIPEGEIVEKEVEREDGEVEVEVEFADGREYESEEADD